ncbi:homeobox protein MIXL1-like [Melanerpes formicivorus]|uniref:homeobox protein MIXL1-like n=1 Tax=Melanerpes formicivorus TaxID=211600 RepID=UPI00358F362B
MGRPAPAGGGVAPPLRPPGCAPLGAAGGRGRAAPAPSVPLAALPPAPQSRALRAALPAARSPPLPAAPLRRLREQRLCGAGGRRVACRGEGQACGLRAGSCERRGSEERLLWKRIPGLVGLLPAATAACTLERTPGGAAPSRADSPQPAASKGSSRRCLVTAMPHSISGGSASCPHESRHGSHQPRFRGAREPFCYPLTEHLSTAAISTSTTLLISAQETPKG